MTTNRPVETPSGILTSNNPARFFGYGLESDPETMFRIIGKEVPFNTGAVAVNSALFIQTVDQTPQVEVAELGGASVQDVLVNNWKPLTDQPFSSYMLKGSVSPDETVTGTVFELGEEEVRRLEHWDIVPFWRNWFFTVALADGSFAETFSVSRSQNVGVQVNGTNYNPFLMGKEETFAAIKSAFENYQA